jgi:hypothetical protein
MKNATLAPCYECIALARRHLSNVERVLGIIRDYNEESVDCSRFSAREFLAWTTARPRDFQFQNSTSEYALSMEEIRQVRIMLQRLASREDGPSIGRAVAAFANSLIGILYDKAKKEFGILYRARKKLPIDTLRPSVREEFLRMTRIERPASEVTP